MLPLVRLRCTHCRFEVDLRQGDATFLDDEAQNPELSAVTGFDYDLLCLSCGAVQPQRCELAAPLPGIDAWSEFQGKLDQYQLGTAPACEACGGTTFAHSTHIVEHGGISAHGQTGPEKLWWGIFQSLQEFFEEVSFQYPEHGEPARVYDGAFGSYEPGLSERLFHGVVSIVRRRSASDWQRYNQRQRRRRFDQFFRTLPREFRIDFRLKHLYFLAQEQRHAETRLLSEVERRIHVLEEGARLVAPTNAHLEDYSCPSCELGTLVLKQLNPRQKVRAFVEGEGAGE